MPNDMYRVISTELIAIQREAKKMMKGKYINEKSDNF